MDLSLDFIITNAIELKGENVKTKLIGQILLNKWYYQTIINLKHLCNLF